MKKLVILLMFAVSGVLSSYSLDLSYEAFGGTNVSSISGIEGGKVKIGWQVGGGVKIALPVLEKKLSVTPQLVFIGKGNKSESKGSSTKEEATNSPIYVEIPIKVGYQFNPFEKFPNFGLTVYVGPYFAYGIGGKHKAKLEANIMGSTTSGENEIDFFKKGYGEKFDCGFVAGIRAGHEIFFDLSYERGFTNVFTADKTYNNNSFVMSVGYKF